jgi:hypothetical protein
VIKSERPNREVILEQIASVLGVKNVLVIQGQVFGQSRHSTHAICLAIEGETFKRLPWPSIRLQMQEIRNWPVFQIGFSIVSQVSSNKSQIACAKSCVSCESFLVSSLNRIVAVSADEMSRKTVLYSRCEAVDPGCLGKFHRSDARSSS